MDQEIKEGRGCGPNKDHVLLELDHLGAETIMKRLPSILRDRPQVRQRRPTKEPIPVVPTIHYQMGGIPTNYPRPGGGAEGRRPERGRQRPVRGRRMRLRLRARRQPPGHQLAARPAGVRPRGRQPHRRQQPEARRRTSRCRRTPPTSRWRAWRAGNAAPAASTRRTSPTTSARTMQQHCGVFRTDELLDEGVQKIMALAERAQARLAQGQVQGVQHRARRGAGARQPDRGRARRPSSRPRRARRVARRPRARDDYPEQRDDANWMKHTLWYTRRQPPRLQAGDT